MTISKETLQFLNDLKKNNNRDWFNERKKQFKDHEAEVKAFFQEVQERLMATDKIEGHKVYRIYRDVRFSKDKSPYKARFSGGLKRATSALRGGYWLNIEPGNSGAGGGFYGPNKEDLLRIRQELELDPKPLMKIIESKQFQDYFGQIEGEGVKSAPRGFDKELPAIDLIRKKQFYVFRRFTDKEVTSKDFVDKVVETHVGVRPFFDYMSEVLTTDLNGVSLID